MLAQIRMEQTYAQIGINTENAELQIRQRPADLNMKQEPAILHIEQPMGVLRIDSSQARSNIDMKGPLQRMRIYAQLGQQRAMEAIAKISQEGDQLRAIEHRGNAIVSLAAQKGLHEPVDVIHADWTDKGVHVSYQKREPKISVQTRGASIHPQIHPAEIHYIPGKVDTYVRVKNSLTIDVVGLNMDRVM